MQLAIILFLVNCNAEILGGELYSVRTFPAQISIVVNYIDWTYMRRILSQTKGNKQKLLLLIDLTMNVDFGSPKLVNAIRMDIRNIYWIY